jgi:hypothetical protein
LRYPAAVVVGGTVLERPQLDSLLEEAEALVHAEPDRSQLQPVPAQERLIGEYERTNFGTAEAVTRVSSGSHATGTTTWREQVTTRHYTEARMTVIDTEGRLVSAEIERRRPEGPESASVRRRDDLSYTVRATAVDGTKIDADLPGPALPGADLGIPAALAAARIAPDQPPWPVIALAPSLANSLPPEPGALTRDHAGFVQLTTDAEVRVSGSAELDEYSLVAPMENLVYHRID